MAKGREVLEMLLPDGGWVIYGDDFDSIRYDEGVNPVSKKQFQDAFAKYDALKTEQDVAKAQAKTALLAQLGITEEQAKLLLS